jgi:hypothetical protein
MLRSIEHLEKNVAAAVLADELAEDDLTELQRLAPEGGS